MVGYSVVFLCCILANAVLLEALLESASNDLNVKVESVTEAPAASVGCFLAMYLVPACAPLLLFGYLFWFFVLLNDHSFLT